MKAVKQVQLHLREGSSDKIYEVDLCEVGEGRYVVNFRYGRRGARLQEGSKTTVPVPLRDAERIFDDLVASKTSKGYQDITGGAPLSAPAARATAPTAAAADARKERILRHLADPGLAWSLSRVAWRAGELKIVEAVPLLVPLLQPGRSRPLVTRSAVSMELYCAAWALGRLGDASALPSLEGVVHDPSVSPATRYIAGEAVLRLSDEAAAAAIRRQALETLPAAQREAAQKGPPEVLASLVESYLQIDSQAAPVLEALYQLDTEIVRPALLQLLKSCPLRTGPFRQVRRIYKAAEFRGDAEVFGLLARRFDKERPAFRTRDWTIVRQPDGTWANRHDKTKKPLSYGANTRLYLRRRTWRTLRRLGRDGDPAYVTMAVGALLAFSDDSTRCRLSSGTVCAGTGAQFWTLNHILYGNSTRYEFTGRYWRCRTRYKPGDPAPTMREESFPELWNQVPQGLLHLLADSPCDIVHEFAVRALRSNKAYVESLPVDAVIMLLGRPYDVTATLGFELATARYRGTEEDLPLLQALVSCRLPQARAQACRWIDERRERWLSDTVLMLELASSAYSDVRQFARTLLRSSAVPEAVAEILIARLISFLMGLSAEDAAQVGDVRDTLWECFPAQLRRVGVGILLDMLGHPLEGVQMLAASIVAQHDNPAVAASEEMLQVLLRSPFEGVRGTALQLLGRWPDAVLLQREGLILTLLSHPLPDIRFATRPLVHRLGENTAFAVSMAARIIDLLREPEPAEGVFSQLVRVLREDLSGWAPSVTLETCHLLLQSPSTLVQELAGTILRQNQAAWAPRITTDELVTLSSHPIQEVRSTTWELSVQLLPRLRQEMAAAIRLLDARWADSRAFYQQFFTEHFTPQEFPPALLIAVCDSTVEEVQQFGRTLLTRCFQEEAGLELLLALSEHPSVGMQTYVTNYLDRYATGHDEHLRTLRPYFLSVLGRVNRARVAKQRVLDLLGREAVRSEAAAQIVGDVLARHSATIAVEEKARALEILADIRRRFPDVSLPLERVEVPAYVRGVR